MNNSFSKLIKQPIEAFLKMEASSGIILAFCAVIAMVIANSTWAPEYFEILHYKIFGMSFQHWINDGLMAIFFFCNRHGDQERAFSGRAQQH